MIGLLPLVVFTGTLIWYWIVPIVSLIFRNVLSTSGSPVLWLVTIWKKAKISGSSYKTLHASEGRFLHKYSHYINKFKSPNH
jgi:hypothetical protein